MQCLKDNDPCVAFSANLFIKSMQHFEQKGDQVNLFYYTVDKLKERKKMATKQNQRHFYHTGKNQ